MCCALAFLSACISARPPPQVDFLPPGARRHAPAALPYTANAYPHVWTALHLLPSLPQVCHANRRPACSPTAAAASTLALCSLLGPSPGGTSSFPPYTHIRVTAIPVISCPDSLPPSEGTVGTMLGHAAPDRLWQRKYRVSRPLSTFSPCGSRWFCQNACSAVHGPLLQISLNSEAAFTRESSVVCQAKRQPN